VHLVLLIEAAGMIVMLQRLVEAIDAPPPHPEEHPKGASRRVGTIKTVATLRDASLRDAPQGEVVV
jgi:hypothetical protein